MPLPGLSPPAPSASRWSRISTPRSSSRSPLSCAAAALGWRCRNPSGDNPARKQEEKSGFFLGGETPLSLVRGTQRGFGRGVIALGRKLPGETAPTLGKVKGWRCTPAELSVPFNSAKSAAQALLILPASAKLKGTPDPLSLGPLPYSSTPGKEAAVPRLLVAAPRAVPGSPHAQLDRLRSAWELCPPNASPPPQKKQPKSGKSGGFGAFWLIPSGDCVQQRRIRPCAAGHAAEPN